MIQTVNGSVKEQYATTSPVSVFWSPSARNIRKKAGISTTVGSMRVKSSAKSESVLQREPEARVGVPRRRADHEVQHRHHRRHDQGVQHGRQDLRRLALGVEAHQPEDHPVVVERDLGRDERERPGQEVLLVRDAGDEQPHERADEPERHGADQAVEHEPAAARAPR